MRARGVATLVAATALLAACGATTPPRPSVPPAAVPSPSAPAAGDALPAMADVPFYRADPAATGVHPGPGPAAKPVLAWRTAVGSMHMVPILVDGLLIVGTEQGAVIALDARSGVEQWTYEAPGPIGASLAAADGIVYASDGSSFHAIDVTTGDQRWSVPVEEASGRVVVADGVAYVGTLGGVIGFDPASGTEVWRWQGPPNVPVSAG